MPETTSAAPASGTASTRRRQLIAGNWKMNGTRASGVALAGAVADMARRNAPPCDLVVCPPATILMAVGGRLAGSTVSFGGQDCHAKPDGAHTGDIAAPMLADLGCRYVIVGHSERRADHGESDTAVKAKATAALAAGLTIILCVGETEAQRDGGQATSVVGSQIAGSLPEGAAAENCIVAYEPVWAIGTGRTPTGGEIAAMHGHIRASLRKHVGEAADRMRLLYGGSVKPSNAAEILALDDVDGALVGGASLKAEDFLAIAAAARKP
ncbi:MAG: triose-phosphate isomerase [Dongiaceae bacterium]